jgi:dUTP pyrophosphatase
MPNSVGIVDADYRGEINIPFMWMPDPLSILEITHPTTKQYGPDGSVIGERLDYMSPKLAYKSTANFKVDKGSRIAQAVLLRYHEQNWRYVDELSETGRGAGGFGSTGV